MIIIIVSHLTIMLASKHIVKWHDRVTGFSGSNLLIQELQLHYPPLQQDRFGSNARQGTLDKGIAGLDS